MSKWRRKKVTATGLVKIPAGSLYGGCSVPVVGTTTTIAAYDATTADAAAILHPATATLTAGQFVSPIGGVSPITVAPAIAGGVILEKGLYLTVGGTGSPAIWALWNNTKS